MKSYSIKTNKGTTFHERQPLAEVRAELEQIACVHSAEGDLVAVANEGLRVETRDTIYFAVEAAGRRK